MKLLCLMEALNLMLNRLNINRDETTSGIGI